MSEQSIPHEAKFLRALGLDPNAVMAETTKIEWKGGRPVLYFVAIHALDPRLLASALVASSEPEVQTGRTDEQIAQGYEDAGSPAYEQEGEGGDAASGDGGRDST